jgi:hypothetical protein
LLAKKPIKKPSACRYGDNVMVDRCAECNAILEQYDDDVIGYCIVVLATFIHREPSLATPLLRVMVFQQYFSYIMAVSFIGGGNWSTWRKPCEIC